MKTVKSMIDHIIKNTGENGSFHIRFEQPPSNLSHSLAIKANQWSSSWAPGGDCSGREFVTHGGTLQQVLDRMIKFYDKLINQATKDERINISKEDFTNLMLEGDI